jgi:hypothetical protein
LKSHVFDHVSLFSLANLPARAQTRAISTHVPPPFFDEDRNTTSTPLHTQAPHCDGVARIWHGGGGDSKLHGRRSAAAAAHPPGCCGRSHAARTGGAPHPPRRAAAHAAVAACVRPPHLPPRHACTVALQLVATHASNPLFLLQPQSATAKTAGIRQGSRCMATLSSCLLRGPAATRAPTAPAHLPTARGPAVHAAYDRALIMRAQVRSQAS